MEVAIYLVRYLKRKQKEKNLSAKSTPALLINNH